MLIPLKPKLLVVKQRLPFLATPMTVAQAMHQKPTPPILVVGVMENAITPIAVVLLLFFLWY
jgi:hypothetical protein